MRARSSVCVMMHWTFCVKRNIENRECETAKPRYNLWLKSFSLLINFAVCVRAFAFMFVSSESLHINIVNFRDASCDALYFSSRIYMWERICLNLYFFSGWKMKLQNEPTKRIKMKLFQIFDTVYATYAMQQLMNRWEMVDLTIIVDTQVYKVASHSVALFQWERSKRAKCSLIHSLQFTRTATWWIYSEHFPI